MKRHVLRPFLAGLTLVVTIAAGAIEPWPTRPLRAIVPVGAGSTTDLIPRIVFETLGPQLGQPIVVENRTGAGGTIGTAAVARAKPDGYTFLAHGSAHTIAPAIYANLTYDPARDFTAVVPMGITPSVLVVAPGRGFRSIADLVAAAKARPGALTFSSVGVGTATHLSAERFRFSAGVEVVHVPYKGGAEAMAEVAAGRVDFFFAPVGLALPSIRDGRLVPLVVNGTRRSAALPDVPTTAESGLAEAEYPIWFGLFLPAGTPRDVVDKLNREMLKALQTPKLQERLVQMGLDPMPMTSREFDTYVQKEIALNAALVRRIGIKPE
ncbi:MAG: tripartite tricarboxylate transporter substrate binding protein [Usitatibacter sp.]